MKIYHISEDTRPITLYHVSPESLTRFSPKSKFFHYKGVYLSPSYRSLITDWAPYVKNKKNKTHPLEEEARKLRRLHQEMCDSGNKDGKDEVIERLHKVYDSINKANLEDMVYKTLYIYTVECPRETYKEAVRIFEEEYGKEESANGEVRFGFWGWGEQIFIPDYLLDTLKVTKKREMSTSDYHNEYDQLSKKRQI